MNNDPNYNQNQMDEQSDMNKRNVMSEDERKDFDDCNVMSEDERNTVQPVSNRPGANACPGTNAWGRRIIGLAQKR